MSVQVETQWKVLETGAPSNRRSERGQRSKAAKSEAAVMEEVKGVDEQPLEVPEMDTEATRAEASDATAAASSASNSRKSRVALSRRKQVPSKRALRKAGEINNDELVKSTSDVVLQATNAVSSSSSDQSTNDSIATAAAATATSTTATTATATMTTTTTTATTTTTTATTAEKNDNSNTANVNVWEARKQQKELLSTQNKKVGSSNASAFSQTNSAYRPPKALPSTVQPVKRINAEATKTNDKEQELVTAHSAPSATLLRQGPSGYRPPHQRGDAPIVKPPDSEEYSHKERGPKGNYRDRDTAMTKTGTDGRTLNREDMGKGYDRSSRPQFGKDEDDKRSNEKKLDESPRDYGSGSQRKGFSGNRRKEDSSWTRFGAARANGSTDQVRADNTNVSVNINSNSNNNSNSKREAIDGVHSVDYPHKRDANNFKRDMNNGFGSKNSTVRSQSLKTDQRLLKADADKPSNVMTRTYSAPKEQLVQVVKLQGSLEQKDEKIMKIKQQMREKAKVQSVTGVVGGFQPILSSAEDALRATFDGNEDITRENAEQVKRELKTNLNPLGPEFAPQQHIPDINASLDHGQFAMDQSGDVVEHAQNMGMYPTYEAQTQAQNEAETMHDPNVHLSWSFHPSDQSVYAQDIGGDMDYDMGHYPNFGGENTAGGPSNATANGGNAPTGGGPPSHSPEQVPVSHALNEAFNTQSTATMATAQPFGDAQANSQMPSDAPANMQMYDYTVQNGGDGMNYAAQPYYPQGAMDPNAMWGPMDNVQAYYGWQMHPHHQQGPRHKSHLSKRKKSMHNQSHRAPKQHWLGANAERGTHHANNDNQAMSSQKKMKQFKKGNAKKGNFANYRTKGHNFTAQNNNNNNNNNNNGNPNEMDTKNNNATNATGQHQHQHQQQYVGDANANAKQQQLQDRQATDREENKEKEKGFHAIPKSFETLTLSGWFIAIESLGPQHLDKFQTQLFDLSPVSLKSFRLEIPSSPVQSSWVNRVQWAQLSAFLSQANLEHVVVSRLQPKVEHYNDQDLEELQPVAKFVSSLKCKCLVLECVPCKITPEFVQSLSDHIEELKLLCPSVQWNVDIVRALSPKLSYLGLICPNSITIQEFLDTLGDKTQKLCLYNDESSPRKLSPEDVSKLFQRVLSLELDGSLLTEIHSIPETTTTKTKALIIRLKDEVPEKDFYEKHSLPKSITDFRVCPIDSSSIAKKWNANAHEDSKLNVNHGSATRAQNMELGYHSESTQKAKREPVYEDNKATPNALQQTQTDGKKMNFKEKVKNSQKNIKKNPLRIGGQTL